uniref:ELAV-like protein 1 n=2 Tax=Triticinae TaxID=1648030 RepID=M8B0A3_AEGTA
MLRRRQLMAAAAARSGLRRMFSIADFATPNTRMFSISAFAPPSPPTPPPKADPSPNLFVSVEVGRWGFIGDIELVWLHAASCLDGTADWPGPGNLLFSAWCQAGVSLTPGDRMGMPARLITLPGSPGQAGLSKRTTTDGLREAFAKFGEVEHARVVTDRVTGFSKGFGFVRYVSVEDAAKGIEGMDGKFLDGWVIFAEYARPRPPPQMGGATPQPQQSWGTPGSWGSQ